MVLNSFTTLLITLLFYFSSSTVHLSPTLLQGVVTNQQTGQPLENVYLYTVEGEEEALTNKKGEFQFTTWKKLPVTLYVLRDNFRKEQLQIMGSPKKLMIQLKQQ